MTRKLCKKIIIMGNEKSRERNSHFLRISSQRTAARVPTTTQHNVCLSLSCTKSPGRWSKPRNTYLICWKRPNNFLPKLDRSDDHGHDERTAPPHSNCSPHFYTQIACWEKQKEVREQNATYINCYIAFLKVVCFFDQYMFVCGSVFRIAALRWT